MCFSKRLMLQTIIFIKKLKNKPYMQPQQVDVLVIGAGPAGTVAASIVNQAGYKVKIVEKQKFPRFAIGESLLPRCMEALEEARFLNAVKARGYQQKNGAKFEKNGKICNYFFNDQFTKGWEWTWQVPRADFDHTLAQAVQAQGVEIAFETGVTAIHFSPDGGAATTVVDKYGMQKEIFSRFIIDGSGYGRVIPQLFRMERPSHLTPRKALFTHLKNTHCAMDDEPDLITIIVHGKAVWIWVIPFSTGTTSVGFVAEPGFFDSFTGTPENILRTLIASQPYVAQRMKDAEFIFEPKELQSWSATTDKFYGNGFVLTGNVTEFLDPVFSSGVTLATVSSQIAGKLVVKKLKNEPVDWEKEYMNVVMQGVNTFRSYVNAWYDGVLDTIFFADNQDAAVKRKICSVLAGYVWDTENDYVKNHETALTKLAKTIQLRDSITYADQENFKK